MNRTLQLAGDSIQIVTKIPKSRWQFIPHCKLGPFLAKSVDLSPDFVFWSFLSNVLLNGLSGAQILSRVGPGYAKSSEQKKIPNVREKSQVVPLSHCRVLHYGAVRESVWVHAWWAAVAAACWRLTSRKASSLKGGYFHTQRAACIKDESRSCQQRAAARWCA